MSKKEDTAFEQWQSEIAAKLNGKALENFQALVSDESGSGILREEFRGHLREGDYYKKLNSLNEERKSFEADMAKYSEEKEALVSWYKTEAPKNAALIAEKQKLVARLGAARQQLIDQGFTEEAATLGEVPANFAANVSHNDDTTSRELEALRQKVDLFDKAMPRLMADFGRVIHETVNGKWKVGPDEIMALAVQTGVDPQTAFYQLTAEERAERAQKELNEQLAKAREEGRREAQVKQASPDWFRPSGPTVVDSLRDSKAVPADHRSRVQAALADFAEEQAAGRA